MRTWRTDIENAPKDGSDVLFPVEFVVRAYWDSELERWVLNRPLHVDYVNAPSRFVLCAPLSSGKRTDG